MDGLKRVSGTASQCVYAWCTLWYEMRENILLKMRNRTRNESIREVQRAKRCSHDICFCLIIMLEMKCIVSDYWSLPANKSSVLLLLSVLAAPAIKYIYWNRLWCCHNFTTNFSHIYGKAESFMYVTCNWKLQP